jgi:hypothetical protein
MCALSLLSMTMLLCSPESPEVYTLVVLLTIPELQAVHVNVTSEIAVFFVTVTEALLGTNSQSAGPECIGFSAGGSSSLGASSISHGALLTSTIPAESDMVTISTAKKMDLKD